MLQKRLKILERAAPCVGSVLTFPVYMCTGIKTKRTSCSFIKQPQKFCKNQKHSYWSHGHSFTKDFQIFFYKILPSSFFFQCSTRIITLLKHMKISNIFPVILTLKNIYIYFLSKKSLIISSETQKALAMIHF